MDSDAQIQSETSQVEFLKDQVQRLNSMLFRYQKKYLPLEDTGPQENGLSERGPQAPWLFSSKHLTPLLREYDHTIQEQKHQIETYKTELASLQANARQLTDENSRLHSELRRVLELQQRSSAVQRRHGMSPKGYTTDTIQEVVDAVQQEKDQYVEMWQRASQQLQQLQSAHEDLIKELSSASLELQETKEDLVNQQEAWREASSAKQQLEMECQRCIMTAQAQTEEINTLRDELRLSKIEHRAATVKLSESKRTAEELQDKMRLKEREMKEFAEVEHTLRSNINQLENEVSTLESRLLLAQKEASTQHTEKSELELSCIDLQKKVNEFKQQEQDVVTHVRDAMQLVENSLLERDQAIVREKQRAQEVTRLQDAMTHLMDQTGEKTQQEVAAVREQCNKNISKLVEELRQMEIDLAERQVTLDRAQREKKTVEKELEKVLRERPEDGSRHSNALQQFQSRIGLAERARDELQLKLNTITTQCRQKEISWEQERMHSESHVAELERRLQSRDQECEQLRDERIKLLGDLDQTNRQARTAEQSREAMERKLAQEVATLQQQQAIKEKEFSHQLENSGDAHRQNTHELRQLLTAQRRIGAKWREESKTLASKLEHTVSEMRAEMIRLKRRNEELTIQIESARTAQHESEQQVGDLQSVQSRLKRLLQDAESRADTASRQIATLLSRERQLLDERKVLHREVDRMHMQATHRRTDVTNRLVKQGTDFMTGFNHSTTRDPTYQATRLELDDPRLLDFELPTRSPALHLEDLTHPRHRTRRQDSEHLSHRDRVSSSEHLSAAAIDNE